MEQRAFWSKQRAQSAVILGVLLAAALTVLGTGPLVNWGGWSLTARFLQAAFHPEIDRDILALTLASTASTIAFAVCGSAVSIAIGCTFGLLASESWWSLVRMRPGGRRGEGRHLARSFRALMAVPRGVHELVWGLFFINVLGLDPLVAVLAIGIPFGAITAKVFAEMIDETPAGVALRFRAAGAGAATAFAYGILPRALPLLLSYALYRVECAVRSAAVLGLIGAGGLGYQIMLSLQSLKYQQVWTFLFALMILIASIDAGSSYLVETLRARTASGLSEQVQQSRKTGLVALATLAVFALSWWYLDLDIAKLGDSRRLKMLERVLVESAPPRFTKGETLVLIGLTWDTLAMSIVAGATAGAAAIVTSWFATSTLFGQREDKSSLGFWRQPGAAISGLVRSGLILIRALSDGIWVLLALFLFFPGAFAGAVALGAYNYGVLGRLLSQVNESADRRAFWALRSSGASRVRAILYGLLPQVMPKYLAYILYRWEVCVRATVVVGIVGAGGLGRRLEEQMASFDYRGVSATLTFYVLLTIGVDALSSQLRKALRDESSPTPATQTQALPRQVPLTSESTHGE